MDLTRVWAGPIGGRIIADLGADVISIESPWNRGLREVDPSSPLARHPDNETGDRPWNRVGGFNKLARNKRGVTLNLQDERGRALFAELVERADVVLENYSPPVIPQLGFDFASLSKRNPHIVYTAILLASAPLVQAAGEPRLAGSLGSRAALGNLRLAGHRALPT